MADLTAQQKKDYARTLYLKDNLTQQEIAEKVGVSRQTIIRWVAAEKWEEMKVGLTLGREQQIANKHGQEIDLLENKDGEKSADCYNRTLKVEQEYKVNSKATASAIDNALRKAARQAEDVVLWIESDISWEDLNAAIRPRIRRSGITHITIVKDGKDRRYSREEILSDNFKIRPADLK